MQIPKFLTSSVNPEQLGLTVKGLLVAIIPTVLLIAGLTHLNLGQTDLTSLADAIVEATVAISTAVSAVMVVVGLIRKILVGMGVIKTNN
jgi:uncharacterized membrane protein